MGYFIVRMCMYCTTIADKEAGSVLLEVSYGKFVCISLAALCRVIHIKHSK